MQSIIKHEFSEHIKVSVETIKSIGKPILIDKPNTDDWYVKIVGMLQQKKAQATSVLTANTFAFTSSV